MGGEIQPQTPVLHLSVALHTPQFPILSPSRAFSFLRPPICRPTRQESPQTKKATKSSHLATFRRSQFNQIQPHVVQSSPRIKRSTERIKPKFNPLQPFAHFVLSSIFSQSTRNSLIYRHSTSFRFTSTLYISFSCPYTSPDNSSKVRGPR